MTENLKQWLDAEMRDYTPVFKKFNNRLMKRVPLWMALSIGGMAALGFGVGYDWTYVLRVHLLIGAGFALFIWFCFWVQTKSASMKKVRAAYEEGLSQLGASDQEGFAAQAPQGGKVDFLNTTSDKYPARLTITPDYWLYYRGACRVHRVADVTSLTALQETARVGYSLGSTRVRQSLGVGVSIVLRFREGTGQKEETAKIYLENVKQLDQARALIARYCPKAASLWE